MAVDQIGQKTHLKQQDEMFLVQKHEKETEATRQVIVQLYQVNGFNVQVVFQRLLELSDHGLHKLAPEVVVPGIEEAD